MFWVNDLKITDINNIDYGVLEDFFEIDGKDIDKYNCDCTF